MRYHVLEVNNMREVKEKDWKLFRKKLPDWQEAFIEKLNSEYVSILSDSSTSSAKRFWEVEKRIKQDRKLTGVICEMRRSMMHYNLLSLLDEGAITLSDLDDFSDELKNEIKRSLSIREEVWDEPEED